MTADEFDTALRAFQRRRPFLPFLLEFVSGATLRITHPEVIRKRGIVYAFRSTDGRYTLFSAGSISHLSDSPNV
jgi:hypothetical protein